MLEHGLRVVLRELTFHLSMSSVSHGLSFLCVDGMVEAWLSQTAKRAQCLVCQGLIGDGTKCPTFLHSYPSPPGRISR